MAVHRAIVSAHESILSSPLCPNECGRSWRGRCVLRPRNNVARPARNCGPASHTLCQQNTVPSSLYWRGRYIWGDRGPPTCSQSRPLHEASLAN